MHFFQLTGDIANYEATEDFDQRECLFGSPTLIIKALAGVAKYVPFDSTSYF